MFGIPGGCQNLLSSPEPPAEAKGNWGGLHGGGRARPLGAKNPETWKAFGWGRGLMKGACLLGGGVIWKWKGPMKRSGQERGRGYGGWAGHQGEGGATAARRG